MVSDAPPTEGALPESYARALELRAAGRSDEDIAAELAIPVEAIDAHLRLAVAKHRRAGLERGEA